MNPPPSLLNDGEGGGDMNLLVRSRVKSVCFFTYRILHSETKELSIKLGKLHLLMFTK